jgi:hypothetical protein
MRRDDRSVTTPCGFVVTDLGRSAEDEETCECPSMIYVRNTVCCRDCGTVYAVAGLQTFRSGWSKMSWQTAF